LTIGAAWIAHTALTERLERTDPIFLRLNLLVLLVVAFLPFPTRLVAEALGNTDSERVAVILYGLTLMAIRVLGYALSTYAQRRHLYKVQTEGTELRREGQDFLPVLAGYALSVLVGLAWPVVSVGLYFGIAIVLVVPFGELTRVLFRNPERD
jgi:uncharacterized membrane protein